MKKKITIRISDSLSDKLSEISEMKNISVSELSRTIFEDYFTTIHDKDKVDLTDNQPEEPENKIEKTDLDKQQNNESIDVVLSVEFFQLVIWMYNQRGSRDIFLDKQGLTKLKDTITKIHSSTIMKQVLKNEFDKVYVDLVKVVNNPIFMVYRPNFACAGFEGFNFYLLRNFIFKEGLGINSVTL